MVMMRRTMDQSYYYVCHISCWHIYRRVSMLVDENLPIEQGGFRNNLSYIHQVMALTNYIKTDITEN